MINLNYQVDEEGKTPEDVAHDFLVEQKLINKINNVHSKNNSNAKSIYNLCNYFI